MCESDWNLLIWFLWFFSSIKYASIWRISHLLNVLLCSSRMLCFSHPLWGQGSTANFSLILNCIVPEKSWLHKFLYVLRCDVATHNIWCELTKLQLAALSRPRKVVRELSSATHPKKYKVNFHVVWIHRSLTWIVPIYIVYPSYQHNPFILYANLLFSMLFFFLFLYHVSSVKRNLLNFMRFPNLIRCHLLPLIS